MKPRTKKQREVAELFPRLPSLTSRQRQWAIEHCLRKVAYKCKNECWCSCCGGVFGSEDTELMTALLDVNVICPHCGKTLNVENSRRRKDESKFYFTIVTTKGCWQVCRNFLVERYLRKGETPFVEIHEAVQIWTDENGHEEVVARPLKMTGTYSDNWNFGRPLEIRERRYRNPYGLDKYKIGGAWVYPERKLIAKVRRNGYTGRNNTGIPESEHVRMLLTDPVAEWLEKTGQFELFGLLYRRGGLKNKHAIRVANRAGYKVKDASMWVDYIGLLEYFHLDTHNAHYVCPRNLKAEHDRLEAKRQRIEAAQAAERKKQEALKNEKEYAENKGVFFGVCFSDGEISVKVVQSVAEMVEEGDVMHHCVARYHNKNDSLILSARDANGNRVETVEVNLKTFTIVQCRAKCNGVSSKHERIMSLVEKNMHLIRKAAATA